MKNVFPTIFLALIVSGAQAQSAIPTLIDAQVQAKVSIGAEQRSFRGTDPSIEWITPIAIDRSVLKGGTVRANLLDRQVEITFPAQPHRANSSMPIWTGVAVNAGSDVASALDKNNARFYTRPDGTLGGSVNIDGFIYQVRTLDGRQVLIKRDARKLDSTPDVPLFKEPRPLPPLKEKSPSTKWSKSTTANIRVVLAFTNAVVTKAGGLGNLQSELNDAISVANDGYMASGIDTTLEIAALALPTYVETSVYDSLVDLYYANGGLWLPHAARDGEYGDVIALVVDTSATEPTLCGQSASLGSVDYTDTVVVVQYNCLSAYSLPHEIGHLMWADHDPDNQIATPPLVDYGHGYRVDQTTGSPGWSTVMAYSNCAVRCPRINLYSSPNLAHNGLPAGTAAVHDNQRLIAGISYWIADMLPDPPVTDSRAIGDRAGTTKFYTPSGVRQLQF